MHKRISKQQEERQASQNWRVHSPQAQEKAM
jgi:hypothetical protein